MTWNWEEEREKQFKNGFVGKKNSGKRWSKYHFFVGNERQIRTIKWLLFKEAKFIFSQTHFQSLWSGGIRILEMRDNESAENEEWNGPKRKDFWDTKMTFKRLERMKMIWGKILQTSLIKSLYLLGIFKIVLCIHILYLLGHFGITIKKV